VNMKHNDEVETITIYKGPSAHWPHTRGDAHKHYPTEEVSQDRDSNGNAGLEYTTDHTNIIDKDVLNLALAGLSKESVWRVKGFVRLKDGVHILNWAFGRFDMTKLEEQRDDLVSIRLTVMGERGEVKRASLKFASGLNAQVL